MVFRGKILAAAALASLMVFATYKGSVFYMRISYIHDSKGSNVNADLMDLPAITITCATPATQEKIVEKIVPGDCSKSNAIQSKKNRDLQYPLMLYGGFDASKESSHIVSHSDGCANIVYYLWCGGNRLFEFKHMLSVLSALKVQQPLKVILYYWQTKAPVQDLYNNWLTELQDTFFNFEVSVIPQGIDEPLHCKNPSSTAPTIVKLLHGDGGIYISEDVVLHKPLNEYRSRNTMLLQVNGLPGVVIGRGFNVDELLRPIDTSVCLHQENMQADSKLPCVSVATDKLYPKDIMTSTAAFYSLARLLFYGDSSLKEPTYDLSNPIPNIGHFYLIGPNTINLFIYLSIHSMISVLKVDTVYVHGDTEPNGDYWQRLKNTGKVKFVFCPPVDIIFGNKIDPGDKFHGKDILSVYLLFIYGGVFIDWDAVFTRPLDDSLRGYDAVLGFDWLIPSEAPTFPEAINPGIIAAKRHSVFISMWLEQYKDFGKKGGFYYTGLLVPYKLYEHYPETVKLEPKFQVICWMNTCHPPWMQGYQNEKFHSFFDWREVYSVHFTYPDPVEFYSESNLNSSTTMYGRIGQTAMGYN